LASGYGKNRWFTAALFGKQNCRDLNGKPLASQITANRIWQHIFDFAR